MMFSNNPWTSTHLITLHDPDQCLKLRKGLVIDSTWEIRSRMTLSQAGPQTKPGLYVHQKWVQKEM